MPKDMEQARKWLEEYLELLRAFDDPYGYQIPGQGQVLLGAAHRQENRIRAIVGELVPNRMWFSTGGHPEWVSQQRASVEIALGTIADTKDMAEHWSSTIDIDVEGLHPLVWNAAKDVWEVRPSAALDEVMKALRRELRAMVEQPRLDGPNLVGHALGLNAPGPGEKRLRVAEDDGSQAYKTIQQGAMFLGQALFSLWRNPESHEGDTPRQQALEGMFAASTFARLIEGATVITGQIDTPEG